MLFIDVDFEESFTFVHFIEEAMDVDYRRYENRTIERKLVDKSDIKEVLFHTKKRGIITTLRKLEVDMKSEGLWESFIVNDIVINKVDLSQAGLRIEEEIKLNGGADLHRFDSMFYIKQLTKSIFKK